MLLWYPSVHYASCPSVYVNRYKQNNVTVSVCVCVYGRQLGVGRRGTCRFLEQVKIDNCAILCPKKLSYRRLVTFHKIQADFKCENCHVRWKVKSLCPSRKYSMDACMYVCVRVCELFIVSHLLFTAAAVAAFGFCLGPSLKVNITDI